MKQLPRILLTLLTLALMACGNERPSLEAYSFERYEPRYAEGFELLAGEEGLSTLIRTTTPWQGAEGVTSELFVRRGGEAIPRGFRGQVLEGDAERIICLSSSYVALLDAAGAVERIVGVSGLDFVANPSIQARRAEIGDVGYDNHLNYELLVALDADLVLLYGVNGASELESKLRELGIPYLYVSEYLEEHPLGKAEWMVVLGEVVGRREEALAAYAPIPTRYNRLKELAAKATSRPKVMLNTPYRDSWFMPSRENYSVRLIEDAGGDYLYAENRSRQSVAIDLERAYLLCAEADVWLNQGVYSTFEELRNAVPRFMDVRCVAERELYNNRRRLSPRGGNDFWESGVVHPDRILEDLIRILHPEIDLGEGELTYYKRLE